MLNPSATAIITHKDIIAGGAIMVLAIIGCALENRRDRKRMTRDEHRTAETWFILIAASFLVLLILTGIAAAHDHEHPELNDWFMSLKNKGKVPCCDFTEAKHLADPDWRTLDDPDPAKPRRYQVYLQGQWRDVPDEALIDEPNRDGRALVWPFTVERYDGNGNSVPDVRIRCFMPGAMT